MSLYAIIFDYLLGKHKFCILSPYAAVSSHLHVVLWYLKHVFLYFIAVIGVRGKLEFTSLNLCNCLLLFIVWLLILCNCYTNSKLVRLYKF